MSKVILDRSFRNGLDLYAPDKSKNLPANDAGMPGEMELPRSWTRLHLNQGVNELTHDEITLVKMHVEAGGGLILSQAYDGSLVITNNLDRDGRKLLKPSGRVATSALANDSAAIIERALNSRITVSLN